MSLFEKNNTLQDNVSLTVQVREKIRSDIHCGRLRADGWLPGMRQLADKYSVSYNIVFRALRALKDECYLNQLDNGRYVVEPSRVGGNGGTLRRIAFASRGEEHIQTHLYQSFYNQLSETCQNRNIQLECLLDRGSLPSEKNRYDALVVSNWTPENAADIAPRLSVAIDTWHRVSADITVKTDHLAGGTMLGRHLFESGRRRLLYIEVNTEILLLAMPIRFIGLERGWCEAGGDLADVKYVRVANLEDMYRLLNEKAAQYDIIVGAWDEIALLIWKKLVQLKLRVPEQIILAGYDGIYEALTHTPPLTTVRQRTAEWVAAVLEACEKPPARGTSILVAPEICIGGSSQVSEKNEID